MKKDSHKLNIYARFNCPLCKAIGTLCIIKDHNMLIYPQGRLVHCCTCNSTVIVAKQSVEIIDH
ncbi:hypothetical protein JXB28_00335 [Candidatus Woesearchaeota archaeon]|nr:hypothetical protein [Candidatus Woesearchaeota archaeon]